MQAVSKHIKIYVRIYCLCSHHVTCTALFVAPQPRLTIGFSDAPSLASSRVRTPSPFRSKLQNTLWTFQQLWSKFRYVPVRLHGRMASVSYQFRFCWVDASLMFTDWTPFCSWLFGNNGAILNFSVLQSLHEWTVMSLKSKLDKPNLLEAAFLTPFFHLHGASHFSSSPWCQARCHSSPILVPHVGCGYRVVEPQQPRKWNRSGPYCLRFANKLSSIWFLSKHSYWTKRYRTNAKLVFHLIFWVTARPPSVFI